MLLYKLNNQDIILQLPLNSHEVISYLTVPHLGDRFYRTFLWDINLSVNDPALRNLRRNSLFLLLCQRPIKYLQILSQSLFLKALHHHAHSLLISPSHTHLSIVIYNSTNELQILAILKIYSCSNIWTLRIQLMHNMYIKLLKIIQHLR